MMRLGLLVKSFSPEKHPHAPAGTKGKQRGGQFVPTKSVKQTPKATPGPAKQDPLATAGGIVKENEKLSDKLLKQGYRSNNDFPPERARVQKGIPFVYKKSATPTQHSAQAAKASAPDRVIVFCGQTLVVDPKQSPAAIRALVPDPPRSYLTREKVMELVTAALDAGLLQVPEAIAKPAPRKVPPAPPPPRLTLSERVMTLNPDEMVVGPELYADVFGSGMAPSVGVTTLAPTLPLPDGQHVHPFQVAVFTAVKPVVGLVRVG